MQCVFGGVVRIHCLWYGLCRVKFRLWVMVVVLFVCGDVADRVSYGVMFGLYGRCRSHSLSAVWVM